MARREPGDEIPPDAQRAKVEGCEPFSSRGGGLAVANMQTHSRVRCICSAGIVRLGLPLNISKGQERNTKGKWISESGAAVPYGMPKEPPFPSYNRNKSV